MGELLDGEFNCIFVHMCNFLVKMLRLPVCPLLFDCLLTGFIISVCLTAACGCNKADCSVCNNIVSGLSKI